MSNDASTALASAAEPGATAHAFIVHLAQRGIDVDVPADASILDALEMEGVIVASVCREGICGTCECRVLEGEIEHHDQVLTPDEQAANSVMMVCVSRARGGRLVLDL